MIETIHKSGNLLEDYSVDAIVNTVNTVGISGAGLALAFKKKYPYNYKAYYDHCVGDNDYKPGDIFPYVIKEIREQPPCVIFNWATKGNNLFDPSQYEYVERGLSQMHSLMIDNSYKSVAIPPVGAGLGGLDYEKVEKIIDDFAAANQGDYTIVKYNFSKQGYNNERG